MNILLVSLNAKYIHTCLAIHSLKAYAEAYDLPAEITIETAEYTINQQTDDIFRDIVRKEPDMIAFSCYIWNIEETKRLALLLHLAMPALPIWLGGPEVSFNASEQLQENPSVFGIMTGEGETVFAELVRAYAANTSASDYLKSVPGIVFRKEDGSTETHEAPAPLDLDSLPFPYSDPAIFATRIPYYESSRGCPFRCSYCLSSIDRMVRFKSTEKVFRELDFFLRHNIPLVKFVDRTFNCDHKRTLAIWNYIKENDNGITRFHFEITADLLNEEELELLHSLRPGLVQLEIGVQSANPDTLKAIHRSQDLTKLKETTSSILGPGNVHQHLDLIAGLPYEDLDSFSRSFDEVYRMKPSQLQLGFLKLLKGSEMHQKQKEYGLCCRPWPPYEVVSTRWISAAEILMLKGIEAVVETYYNSGQFTLSLEYLLHFYERPWDFYSALSEWMETHGHLAVSHARQTKYDLLRLFAKTLPGIDSEALDSILLFDMYLRENLKSRPDWAPLPPAQKDGIGEIYANENFRENYLPDFKDDSVRQIRHETHLELFPVNVFRSAETGQPVKEDQVLLFNYRSRNPLDHSAFVLEIAKDFSE